MVNLPQTVIASMKQNASERFEDMLALLLLAPLSHEEQRKQMANTGKVAGVVTVLLSDLMGYHYNVHDWLLEVLSDKLVGHSMLLDQKRELVFAEPDTLYFKVTGKLPDTPLEIPTFALVSGDDNEGTN